MAVSSIRLFLFEFATIMTYVIVVLPVRLTDDLHDDAVADFMVIWGLLRPEAKHGVAPRAVDVPNAVLSITGIQSAWM